MDELAERIKASLENPNGEPWFPEITADLVARAWDNLYREMGLTPGNYSTERILSRNVSAPREIIACLETFPSTGPTAQDMAIELLTPEWVIKYQEQGVSFYSSDEILKTTILSSLEDALAVIKQVPSLMNTVGLLVRSLHVLKPEDEEYDVSFSEPHVPFSIFVSVPQKRIANDALRVAEAMVHEVMHLQLTLIEQRMPLVQPTDKQHFSPWKATNRPLGGVFHAMYVFGVVDRFLKQLPLSSRSEYLRQRRNDIWRQMMDTESFKDLSYLTPIGSQLARWITVPSDPV